MPKTKEVYEVHYKISSSIIVEGKTEEEARTNAELFTKDVSTRFAKFLPTNVLNCYVTDILAEDREYENGMKDFEAHYLLEGVHLIIAESEEESKERFNSYINNKIQELERNVFFAGVRDPEGYVTKTALL